MILTTSSTLISDSWRKYYMFRKKWIAEMKLAQVKMNLILIYRETRLIVFNPKEKIKAVMKIVTRILFD